MRNAILIAGLVVAGCLPVRPHEFTPVDEDNLRDTFGDVPIIHPGMPVSDVERLLGPGRSFSSSDGDSSSADKPRREWTSYRSGLSYDQRDGKVHHCWCGMVTVTGQTADYKIDDADLAKSLGAGLTPKEVADEFGRPSSGFCTEVNTVTLLYQTLGIQLIFTDGKLVRWQRVVTYKDEPVSQKQETSRIRE